ncbi:MAG: hypothetical protein R3Y35_03955 [Clostridia bacterium]
MKNELIEQVNWFRGLNEYTQANNILFVGSTFIHDFPINELEVNFQLADIIYNRGIKGLKLNELKDILDVCVYDINPSKIILSIGEEDIKDADFSVKGFISQYSDIVCDIRKKLPNAKLYIMGIMPTDDKYQLVNQKLQLQMQATNIEYIDFSYHLLNTENKVDNKFITEDNVFLPNAYVAILVDLKRFFRNRMMGFGDIINMAQNWY